MSLAIYCFVWNEGGAEKRKLDNQEKAGRKYAAGRDCEIYQDTSAEVGWVKRPDYERMKQAISDGKIDEVWARDSTRLHPFKGEKEPFEALCKSKGVKMSFGSGSPAK